MPSSLPVVLIGNGHDHLYILPGYVTLKIPSIQPVHAFQVYQHEKPPTPTILSNPLDIASQHAAGASGMILLSLSAGLAGT